MAVRLMNAREVQRKRAGTRGSQRCVVPTCTMPTNGMLWCDIHYKRIPKQLRPAQGEKWTKRKVSDAVLYIMNGDQKEDAKL